MSFGKDPSRKHSLLTLVERDAVFRLNLFQDIWLNLEVVNAHR